MRQAIALLLMKNRSLFLLAVLAITVFFGFGVARVEIKTIFSDLFPKNHPYVQTFKDHPDFGNPLAVTVMVKRKDGDIYNADTLQKIWDMTREIGLTPGIDHDSIVSIASEKARFTESTPFGINSLPLMDDAAPSSVQDIDRLRTRVDQAPNVRQFLISEDEAATLIEVKLIERLVEYDQVFEFVQGLAERERDEDHEVYVAGAPILNGWVYTYEAQMIGIFAITALALVLSLFLYMRNIIGIFIPIVASIISAIWGFGFVGWIGSPIEPLIMVVPLLLVARAFSHCVQFIERYYEVLAEVKDKQRAAIETLEKMMAPGALGIFTDAAGLFLIAIAPIPVMERFAIFCGFWALILIPANLFLTPVLVSILPTPKNLENKVLSKDSGDLDKPGSQSMILCFLNFISSLVVGKSLRVTSVLLIALLGFSLYLLPQIRIGNSVEGSNILWEDSDYNIAVRQINRNFPGLMTLEIIFENKTEDRILKQADTINTMAALQRYLEKQPDPPEASLSFADYLPDANRFFSGGNQRWAPVDPTDQGTNAAVNALLFGASTKTYSSIVDFELTNGTVSLWYKDNKQETVDVALQQARDAIELVGAEHENFRIRLGSGAIALQQSVNDTVDEYQWLILAALNVVILITCALAYGSVVAGILLMIPVNFSNLLLGSVMVGLDIGLDVNTLPIAAIGVGVGIDYGIYLLSRICEEYRKSGDYVTAIRFSIGTTGKAIFFTSSIVLIGITPWYFLSDLKFLADLGFLMVMVMLINMLIALIVVPLLVNIIRPRFVSDGMRAV